MSIFKNFKNKSVILDIDVAMLYDYQTRKLKLQAIYSNSENKWSQFATTSKNENIINKQNKRM